MKHYRNLSGIAALLAGMGFFGTAALGQTTDSKLGETTYAATCSACHQPNGQGLEGAFPPLAGHTVDVLKAPEGRSYLIRTLLWGVEGTITANGKQFEGAMPPWNSLNDEQIAATLDYVLKSWGNDKLLPGDFKPVTAAEVAAERKTEMAALDVYNKRPLKGPEAGQQTAQAAVSFTAMQVENGEMIYQKYCLDCHGENLDDGEFGGAPLKGSWFRNNWGNGSLAPLFAFTKTKMPPNRPGGLEDEAYADVLAYILSRNGYQPGKGELPMNAEAQQKMTLKR